MGNIFTKNKKINDLHIITYNYNNSNLQYNKNILNNFINKYDDDDNIICVQGLRDIDLNLDNKKYFFVNELGLLIITNLEIVKTQYSVFNTIEYDNINSYKYGFQKLNLNYLNINFCIYNLELVPNSINEFDLNEIRENEMIELITFICNNINEDKIHIVTGCFYDMNKNFNELINISKITNIITNLKTCNQESYIFFYSSNLIKNIDNLNDYIFNKFNIEVISHKIYNLNIGVHCPFETILRLKEN